MHCQDRSRDCTGSRRSQSPSCYAEAWAAAPPPKRTRATFPAEAIALSAAAVHNCRLRCPWWSFTTPSEPGLVSHITKTHVGETFASQAVVFFDGLGRGLCVECGALRTRRCSQCGRCRTSSLPRQLRIGDCIVAPRLGPVSVIDELGDNRPGDLQGGNTFPNSQQTNVVNGTLQDLQIASGTVRQGPERAAAASHRSRASGNANFPFGGTPLTRPRATRSDRPQAPRLSADFDVRCRQLPGGSMLHIPVASRERLCAI